MKESTKEYMTMEALSIWAIKGSTTKAVSLNVNTAAPVTRRFRFRRRLMQRDGYRSI